MKTLKLAFALLAMATSSSFAAEVEERDPLTGLTHREKIAAERVEDARRVAAEPAWRPWHTDDARTSFGLPSLPAEQMRPAPSK
ncbi:hypothetical protein [Bradyrhizobium sp. YR681]|uniref:hypothetical protein n=1 Tax=Bradyrhizobium sp. YR681 TaxID=1144344 RepID=UPI0012F68EFA|nr:hypothetical protein [Bradyrhizobium sp. YR681]